MSAQCAVGAAEMKRSPVVRGARGGNSARGARANPYRNERRVRPKREKRRLRLRRNLPRRSGQFIQRMAEPSILHYSFIEESFAL